MITIRQCALNVCADQAALIVGGDESAWVLADKIERRWRIQGATLHHVDRMRAAEKEFKKQQSLKHDALYPDRKTYLHR